jgi:hypothetical protein
MLDARYLMLDIQQYIDSEIRNHPGSRNQYLSEAQALRAGGHDQSILPMVFVETAEVP